MSESTNSLKSLQFTWKITNYSQQKLKNEPGKRIISQAFPGDCESDLEFTLYFYPQGHVQAGDNEVTNGVKWASLFLHTESSKNYDTFHHFEFSILDADGEKFCIHHFHQNIPFLKRGYHQFIPRGSQLSRIVVHPCRESEKNRESGQESEKNRESGQESEKNRESGSESEKNRESGPESEKNQESSVKNEEKHVSIF